MVKDNEFKKTSTNNSSNNPISSLIFNEIMDLKEEVSSLKERVAALEAKVDMLVSQNKQLSLILKYVVTPLIIILGALIGVKLTLP